MGLEEIIEAIVNWKSLTGLAGVSLLIFLILLFAGGGEDAVTASNEVIDARETAKTEVLNAGVEASTSVYSGFADVGDNMAENVDDPNLKLIQKGGWRLIGFLLGVLVFFKILIGIGILKG